MSYNLSEVIDKYVALRDQKRTMVREHEEALKPIDDKLNKIETWLLGRMNEDGVENYKTEFGTAYKTIKTSVTMADRDMFKDFVFSSSVPLWNLVDFRASKKGVEEFLEDSEEIPPGLNITRVTTVNVRSK